MKKRLSLYGLNLKTTAILSAFSLLFLLLELAQRPAAKSSGEWYLRLMPVQIYSVAFPLIFCALAARPVQRLLQSNVVACLSSRLSVLLFQFKRSLLYAVLTVLIFNLPTIVVLAIRCADLLPSLGTLLYVMLLQSLHLTFLAALQLLMFLFARNWYLPYCLTVLVAFWDFVSLNIMPEPVFLGWGLTLAPWSADLIHPAVTLSALLAGSLALLGAALWKTNFLFEPGGQNR